MKEITFANVCSYLSGCTRTERQSNGATIIEWSKNGFPVATCKHFGDSNYPFNCLFCLDKFPDTEGFENFCNTLSNSSQKKKKLISTGKPVHTCMSEKEIEEAVTSINTSGGHCLGFKLQKLADDRRQQKETCKVCQEEKTERGKIG